MCKVNSPVCPECGNEFPARYASERRCYPCQAGRPEATPYQLPCQKCGTLVWRHRSRWMQGYCQSCCERPCRLCEAMYWPEKGDKTFCQSCTLEIRIRKSALQDASRACPDCGSLDAVRVIPGVPTESDVAAIREGRAIWGGCNCPSETKWACRECGAWWPFPFHGVF